MACELDALITQQRVINQQIAWLGVAAGQKEGFHTTIYSVEVAFLPARRYASGVIEIATCLSVRLSVRPSRAGIVSKRRKLAA